MNAPSRFDEVLTLAARGCDDRLSQDDVEHLEQLLQNPDAQRCYLQFVELDMGLSWLGNNATTPLQLPALRRRPVVASIGRAAKYLSHSSIAATLLVASVVYGGFGLIVWQMSRYVMQQEVGEAKTVARLIAANDCQWNSTQAAPEVGAALPTGEIDLASGTAEFVFAHGARVTLEGPAKFHLEHGDRGRLDRGKLFASVPREAVGFTVTTPTATIVDLGTEFAVEVSDSGTTDVKVVRGAVDIARAATESVKHGSIGSTRVVAGQFARIDRHQLQVKASEHHAKADGAAYLDLADVVAGGNGFEGRRDRGIEPATGHLVYAPDAYDHDAVFSYFDSGGYCHVDDRPFIDGVAIPDSRKGPVQISSTGLEFNAFPATSGTGYGPIWAGGAIPVVAIHPKIRTTFDGKTDYAVAPHCLIAMHANKLITFDLEAIRRAYPQRSLSAFRAIAGVTKQADSAQERGLADIWVFVDGEVRHERTAINSSDGPEAIEVPLAESARFLTLAATDAGNKPNFDWVLFCDPRIELDNK